MDVTRGSGYMWLDPDRVVSTALDDFDKGRVFSIPGLQYKAIAGVSRVVPNRILQRFQSIGRR
jgi:hypothetical protein